MMETLCIILSQILMTMDIIARRYIDIICLYFLLKRFSYNGILAHSKHYYYNVREECIHVSIIRLLNYFHLLNIYILLLFFILDILILTPQNLILIPHIHKNQNDLFSFVYNDLKNE